MSKNEVTTTQEQMPAQQDTWFQGVVEKVMSNPEFNVEKMGKLFDFQDKVMRRNAEMAYDAALAEMQNELPMIQKKGIGHNTKYARIEDIDVKVRPILSKHGFSIKFEVEQEDKAVKVIGYLRHREGHKESAELILPLDTTGSKGPAQQVGSTVTYGRRYVIMMLLNIATTEDDLDALEDAPINADKVNELKERLKNVGRDEQAFLNYMKVERFEDIMESRVHMAEVMIAKAEQKELSKGA
jgi:hypothetical protein